MARALSVLAFLALALGLYFMPGADPTRIAAIEASELLALRVGEEPDASVPDERPTLAQVILDSAEVQRTAPGKLRLSLSGVRMSSDRPGDLLLLHGVARSAIMRGLRAAAAERGESLEIHGDKMPAVIGSNFMVELVGERVLLTWDSTDKSRSITVVRPGYKPATRWALVPPLVAIFLAVLVRRPVIALLAGVWTATALMRWLAGSGVLASAALGLPDVVTKGFLPELKDPDRLGIMGFVVAMLAMVGVMTRSGGIRGLMNVVARLASNAKRTQIATYLMGLVVFFDDYANCILVGSTMRPLCDRFRVSREKLSYLVDSTAAPVAGISIFSTWIAYEVSTFSAQLPAAGYSTEDGYSIFVQSLPFRFYCIFTLVLAATIVFTGRDFGPMLHAERRARRTGQVVREGGKPMVGADATSLEPAPGITPRAMNALLPVLAFVLITLLEIVRVGWGAMKAADPTLTPGVLLTVRGITGMLGDGESTRALLVGSTSGLVLAALLALRAGMRGEILRAAWTTLRSMGIAIAILYLAWMIGSASKAMGTATYLTALLGDGLPPELLPSILFLLGAVVAFSTGSSWSTMSILLPLVVGLAFNLGELRAEIGGHLLMLMSIGAVLEGAIFGDHCSPISDTTVLSSTASASDHIDHVRTQMPYALLAMLVALVVGYLPVAFVGHNPWIALLIGAASVVLFVRVFGRKSDEEEPVARAAFAANIEQQVP